MDRMAQLQDMSVKVTTEVAEVETPKASLDDSAKVNTLPSVSMSRRHMPPLMYAGPSPKAL